MIKLENENGQYKVIVPCFNNAAGKHVVLKTHVQKDAVSCVKKLEEHGITDRHDLRTNKFAYRFLMWGFNL